LVRKQYVSRVAIQPWPVVPFVKGSYSVPKTGQFTSIMGYNEDAECDGRLHFAGEHTHSSFGYMNSAFSSGFRAANEVLEQLSKPTVDAPGRDLVPEGADDGDN
jgi:monoamine oxidase